MARVAGVDLPPNKRTWTRMSRSSDMQQVTKQSYQLTESLSDLAVSALCDSQANYGYIQINGFSNHGINLRADVQPNDRKTKLLLLT